MSIAHQSSGPGVRNTKHLAFQLGHERFAVPIHRVREIIRSQTTTRVPKAPAHVLGVTNLRGRVLPVLDLRRKFQLPIEDYNDRACIVVVQLGQGTEQTIVGLLVGDIPQVINVAADQVEPPPDLGAAADAAAIQGLAKVEGAVVIMLDIDRTISTATVAIALPHPGAAEDVAQNPGLSSDSNGRRTRASVQG